MQANKVPTASAVSCMWKIRFHQCQDVTWRLHSQQRTGRCRWRRPGRRGAAPGGGASAVHPSAPAGDWLHSTQTHTKLMTCSHTRMMQHASEHACQLQTSCCTSGGAACRHEITHRVHSLGLGITLCDVDLKRTVGRSCQASASVSS